MPQLFGPPAGTSSFTAPGSVDDVASQRSLTSAGATLSFPPESIAYGTTFRFVQYKYANQKNNAQFIQYKSGAHIFLPLPAQIAMQQGVTYEGVDAGVLGYALKAGSSAAESVGHQLESIQRTGKLGNIKSTLGTLAKNAAAGAEYVLRKFAADITPGMDSQVDQMLGNVVNPFNVATFKHSDPRSFQLSFMLIPRTSDESKLIKTICDTFVWHSLPYRDKGSVQGVQQQGQSMFLDMPDEVEIAFFGSQSLFQFARAVIATVDVNYSPFGIPSFFNDQSPTAIQLSLGIREIQQLTRDAFNNSAGGQQQFSNTNVDTSSVTNINGSPDSLDTGAGGNGGNTFQNIGGP